MGSCKAALCQIEPAFDVDATVKHALGMIREAAGNGAEIVALPEMFYYPYSLDKIRSIVGKEDEFLGKLAEIAKEFKLYLSTGSMAFMRDNRLYNMSHLIGPDGVVLGEYTKCHLYDAHLNGTDICESSLFTPGNMLTVIDTPLCTIGIMICYDIRFPEFSRLYALENVDLLLVPSVFNTITGSAHWHTVMCGRAIENQFFIAATSQARKLTSSYKAYGHSMVVGPWGEICGEAGEAEQIVYADIDLSLIENAKKKLPLLSHRREDIYNLRRV